MKKMKPILFLIVACICFKTQVISEVPQKSTKIKIVRSSQVNGTWSNETGEFKILALGNQKIKIEFIGSYGQNTGEAGGIAHIEGNTAIFYANEDDPKFVITLRFEDGKLYVMESEEGASPFGLNVTSVGMYKRVSNKKPEFIR